MPIIGHDVAGAGAIDFLALVGVHLHDAAETLLLIGALVEVHVPLVDRSLIDAHERQLAERILDDLEGHAHEWLARIGLQREVLIGLVPLLGLDRAIERRRQIANRSRPAATARPCCDRRCR